MDVQITPNESSQRLDRFLRKYFKPYQEITLNDIYRRLRHGDIRLNGKKAKENTRLNDGDVISRPDSIAKNQGLPTVTANKKQKVKSYALANIKQYIVYEDDNRIRRNKPADMVTHPGNKHTNDVSLHDLMQSYLQQTNQKPPSQTFNPSFCYRLDKDTTGLIISAKQYEALQLLNELIRLRKTRKTYLAVVVGEFHGTKTVDKPLFIGFDQKSGKAKTFINTEKGKESTTTITGISTQDDPHLGLISLVAVSIVTGRMHQIRVHSASLGFPIVGDITYGNNAINRLLAKHYRITRQLLHCRSYGFFDTLQNKELSYSTPVPDDFISLFPTAGDSKFSKKRSSTSQRTPNS